MGEAILSFLVLVSIACGVLYFGFKLDTQVIVARTYRIYKVEGGAIVACKSAQLTECGMNLSHCENGAKHFCQKSVTEIK